MEWNSNGTIQREGMSLSFHVSTHITPLENGDYAGYGTLTVWIFKILNGILKSKGMSPCLHVSTHITPLENRDYEISKGYPPLTTMANVKWASTKKLKKWGGGNRARYLCFLSF